MKIIYFLDAFPKLSESFILNELKELDNRGHDVSVFALENPNEETEHEGISEMDVYVRYLNRPSVSDLMHLFDSNLASLDVLRSVKFERNPVYAAYHLHLGLQCTEFVREEAGAPDVIHGHFATHTKLGARFAADILSIPFTVTGHAYEMFPRSERSTARRVFESSDRAVAPSEYNKRFMQDELEVQTPIDVVYATTDVSEFEPDGTETEPYRLLTVARLVEKKGHRYALRAVKQLADQYPNVEYRIVGKGPLNDDLQSLVDELGIKDNVTFLGHISDSELRDEYRRAAVFILPCVVAEDGDRDVIPVVLKEAMGAETPCVSTDVAGIPELITDGENGCIVPQRNEDALAETILKLLERPDQRRRMGRSGRQTVQDQFGIQDAVDELLSTFNNALE